MSPRHGRKPIKRMGGTLPGAAPGLPATFGGLGSNHDPNALTDSDVMPFGVHRGKTLGEVPDTYWRWFLQQAWCDERPDLVTYANNV